VKEELRHLRETLPELPIDGFDVLRQKVQSREQRHGPFESERLPAAIRGILHGISFVRIRPYSPEDATVK
jgi:hypothetical protein